MMNFIKRQVIPGMALFQILACNNHTPSNNAVPEKPAEAPAPILSYTIVNTYPHDSTYFTEGLEFHGDRLFESSGGNTDESPYPSAFGIADLKTGKVSEKVKLDASRYFGEGITILGDRIYQLTWVSGVGFVYDLKTFRQTGTFKIPSSQGWGLTHDSTQLYMSDGSSNIYVINPEEFRIVNTLRVSDHTGPLANINELEYVAGSLFANQWQTPYIYRIDATTGKVTGKLDFTKINDEISEKYSNAHEMNGIAWNANKGTFFITGKKWPLIYEIRLY